jgi:hypothetical protein
MTVVAEGVLLDDVTPKKTEPALPRNSFCKKLNTILEII